MSAIWDKVLAGETTGQTGNAGKAAERCADG